MKQTLQNILPKSVIELSDLFAKSGYELYLVGGAVRDFLMGKQPKDFDLCTNATPEQIMQITKTYDKNMQGAAFGVIVVYTTDNSDGYEIATFRSDIYDGKLGMTRNPDIKFTTIENDSDRRDLTINAMYYDIANDKIIDFHGGIQDIESKVIKMVGNPKLRLLEDKLRSLRAIRFATRYGYSIDVDTFEAIASCDLDNITMERIWGNDGEIQKAFTQSNFHEYINMLYSTGLVRHIFKGFDINMVENKFKYIESYIAEIVNDFDINRLVQELKIPLSIVKKGAFLKKVKIMSDNDAYPLFKMKTNAHIQDDMIIDFIGEGIQDIHARFMSYVPTINSEELMSEGFSGKALGEEIHKRETENFSKIFA